MFKDGTRHGVATASVQYSVQYRMNTLIESKLSRNIEQIVKDKMTTGEKLII